MSCTADDVLVHEETVNLSRGTVLSGTVGSHALASVMPWPNIPYRLFMHSCCWTNVSIVNGVHSVVAACGWPPPPPRFYTYLIPGK